MGKSLEKYESILIAGASGMVGSALLNALNNKFKNNPQKPKLFFPYKDELNYLDTASVFSWFKENNPKIVIIAAAKVGGIIANKNYPTSFLLDNLKIQNNLIEAAYKNNVERLLFLGSSCIYPKFAKQPIKEEYLLTGPLEETNESYAIAKIAGIKLCSSLRREFGFDAITLMPTNLYGPGDNYSYETSHVMPALIRRIYEAKESGLDFVKCLGSGKSLREFLYVEDLAEACIFALENWNFGDTFFFTELSAFVMFELAPDISNFIIVPKAGNQSFGSLFEISSESNEIFISGAKVSDIEIIDAVTAAQIKATGIVTTSSTSTSSSLSGTLASSSSASGSTSSGSSSGSGSGSSSGSGYSSGGSSGGSGY